MDCVTKFSKKEREELLVDKKFLVKLTGQNDVNVIIKKLNVNIKKINTIVFILLNIKPLNKAIDFSKKYSDYIFEKTQ